ncbi:hypothetical protein L596_025195 [Steinernema carpocapsae]|uniref:Uncharacterized protein n=1 Tax=Steinernema carpocapsae TaxID=34508 RepID=A0A4V5ZYR1_STECR|nr:hypothetical protein L596_025195 [Steinernema carpocapsae]
MLPRNFIKVVFYPVLLYTIIANLLTICIWIRNVYTDTISSSLFIFADFFNFNAIRLLRSAALGASFIRLKTHYSWSYTHCLARKVFCFMVASFVVLTGGYIASISLNPGTIPWNCRRMVCFFYGHQFLIRFKLAMDLFYALALLGMILITFFKAGKTAPEEKPKGWSEEKIEFFTLNNRLYAIYIPSLLAIVIQGVVIQAVLQMAEVENKSYKDLLDGYERMLECLETTLMLILYFCLILRKVSKNVLSRTRFEA